MRNLNTEQPVILSNTFFFLRFILFMYFRDREIESACVCVWKWHRVGEGHWERISGRLPAGHGAWFWP